MKFVQPRHCVWKTDKDAALLVYDGDESALTEVYHIRGGICWPRQVMTGDRHRLTGFICIGCQRISDGVVFVLAEHRFACIDNVYDEKGQVVHEGVTQFVNTAWSAMMCRRFYFRESQETHRRYYLQLGRSDLIRDTPVFSDVYWDDDTEARHAILESRQVGRLKLDEDGELWRALQTWKAQPDTMAVYPEMHALTCLLRGFQEYPHHLPESEDTIVRV